MEVRTLLFHFPNSFRGCLNSQFRSTFAARRNASSTKSSSTSSLPRSPATTNTSTTTKQPDASPPTLGSLSQLLNSNEPVKPLEEYTNELNRPKEHHLHVYAHRHNCHITLTGPSYVTATGIKRDCIITLSAGNIGFRKGQRGSYDAAYQLGSYMMSRIQSQGLLQEIQRLEVVLRGFGSGRDAVSKILLGVEGAALRPRIVKVVDSTKLKIGGTRAKKPRRL